MKYFQLSYKHLISTNTKIEINYIKNWILFKIRYYGMLYMLLQIKKRKLGDYEM